MNHKFQSMPEGVQEKQCLVNGISCTYWEVGDGEPLVMAHGGGPGGDGISNWYVSMPLFAERGFRAIAINLLGFGIGDYPAPGTAAYPSPGFAYDKEARRGHLLAQLDALDIDTAHLMGNSMGGSTALGLCMIAPERVRRLVLMGSGGLHLETKGLTVAGIKYTPDLEAMRHIVRGLNNQFPLADEDEIVRYRHQVSVAAAVTHQATMSEAIDENAPGGLDADRFHVWPENDIALVKTPTLVVHGREDDLTTPETGLRFHRLLENSWLASFPESGHWTMIRYPEAYADLCSWFLQSKTLQTTSA